MVIIIQLEAVPDPLSPESLQIQASILNSQPAFNLMVEHKAYLEPLEIREDNRVNLEMGEKMLYIKAHTGYAGLTTFPITDRIIIHGSGFWLFTSSIAGRVSGRLPSMSWSRCLSSKA